MVALTPLFRQIDEAPNFILPAMGRAVRCRPGLAIGSPGRIRTSDQRINSARLYH